MFSWYGFQIFLKLPVTIPLAPIITGIIVHIRFHIRCISIHKLLYFNFFSASFCTTFLSAGIATSISVHVFSFLFLIIISGLFAVTSLSVCCFILLILQHCNISLFIHWLGHVCVPFVSFQCLMLCILSNANVHKLYRLSLSIRSSPKWGIPRLLLLLLLLFSKVFSVNTYFVTALSFV